MKKDLKILQINSTNFGSTGNIMLSISKRIEESRSIAYVAYPKSRSNAKKDIANSFLIGNRLERNMHLKLAYYTGYNGCFSRLSTKRFLKKIDNIKPDIIHLHNLHNCYINLGLLFKYIKKNDIKVVWTLHDCWAFTGQCPHFSMVKCDKWKTGCYDCPQYMNYPESLVDRTKVMYNKKKKWFSGVKNLHIVTPSNWLSDRVKESYLGKYPVTVINNGIDTNLFKPTKSSFRKDYGLDEKIIILGAAHSWGKQKGLDIFVDLSSKLDEKYKIVLVGLTKEQTEKLPENIIAIERTSNAAKLAEIYTAADYFINPSRQETMGLVTVEALACGTPAIVSNFTAVPEMVDEKCGVVVEGDSANEYHETIVDAEGKFAKEDCINYAKKYDKSLKYNDYLNLYGKLTD